MNDSIRSLLKANMTPEMIYKTALEELQKIQKEAEEEQKKKEKEAKLNAARDTLITSAMEYVKFFIPVEQKDVELAKKELLQIESLLKADKPVKTKITFDPDEIFASFLENLK